MATRSITVAKHAGFCFGVKRATDRLEQALTEARQGERVYTLGHLIHNDVYNRSLEARGVRAIESSEIEQIAMRANAEHAQAQAVREREEAQRVPQESPKPEKLAVRSAEEFEF